MFVPDNVRKCVAFVGYQLANGETAFAGTAFFLGRDIEGTNRVFQYAVTAKHVIDKIKAKGINEILLRLNFDDGAARWMTTQFTDWVFHPTEATADVAVMRVRLPANADHRVPPLTRCVSDRVIRENDIGLGDEVFVTGLFANHSGQRRNISIVRVGNIAAMPEEPVNSRFGFVEAYLIEARSTSATARGTYERDLSLEYLNK